MKKDIKRALTLLLALALCLGLLPMTALAEETDADEQWYGIGFCAGEGLFPDGINSIWKGTARWKDDGYYLEEIPPAPHWKDETQAFSGWDIGSGTIVSQADIGKVKFTSSQDVNAVWRANSNTLFLYLDPNGGTCSVTRVELDTSGTAPTLKEDLPTPTRSGYRFDGWFVGGTQVQVGGVFSGGETAVAQWKRASKITPSLKVIPDKIEAGAKKTEIYFSCATDGAALDWRPLERVLYMDGKASDVEAAAKSYISGNFSAVGLKLTDVQYQYDVPVNDSAYPYALYPDGVYPTTGLTLTLEGAAKAGTLDITLAPGIFVQLVGEDEDTVLTEASADIFNPCQVKIPVGDGTPAKENKDGPFTVKFDLGYENPRENEIPKEQKVAKGQTVALPDGTKLTSPATSHEFYAWCMKDEKGKLYPWKDGTAVTADMTLYAGWIRKGTVIKDGQAVPKAPAAQTTPAQPAPSTPAKTAFTDVAASSPFAAAISWAVEQKITNGKTATTFGPGDPCTRAQIVTFLWRAAGSPEPGTLEAEYADVTNRDAYYYKAVQWAAEMGMEGSGTFSPHDTCTRVTAVYFIWTAFGSPKAAAKASFEDVQEPERGQWYWPDLPDAVDWAVETGVTTGKTATTFGPGDPCTRGQIVTFLYRAYVK